MFLWQRRFAGGMAEIRSIDNVYLVPVCLLEIKSVVFIIYFKCVTVNPKKNNLKETFFFWSINK